MPRRSTTKSRRRFSPRPRSRGAPRTPRRPHPRHPRQGLPLVAVELARLPPRRCQRRRWALVLRVPRQEVVRQRVVVPRLAAEVPLPGQQRTPKGRGEKRKLLPPPPPPRRRPRRKSSRRRATASTASRSPTRRRRLPPRHHKRPPRSSRRRCVHASPCEHACVRACVLS